jgi:DNA-binding GntR family transcriptional regulator
MKASDRAYRAILDEILEGTLAPGAVLAEVEQSTRLGVSRTPVREALSRLVADGLVEPLAGRGLIVTEVSLDNIVELYELREALEEQAARLAAQRGKGAAFVALATAFEDAPRFIDGGQEGLRLYYDLNRQFDEAIDDAIGIPIWWGLFATCELTWRACAGSPGTTPSVCEKPRKKPNSSWRPSSPVMPPLRRMPRTSIFTAV